MAVLSNTTMTADITTEVRELDFISRFESNWDALSEILGIMRPIRKQPGTKLTGYRATVTLESGDVAEGELIPFSKAKVEPIEYGDIKFQKYTKAVTGEAVTKHGAARAAILTDNEMIVEIQDKVMNSFYEFMLAGELTGTEDSLQMAIAMSVAKVKNKFKQMHKNFTNIVVFVNGLDMGEYLGRAAISTQTQNGVEYLKNFLGASTVILTADIPAGTVVAIPADNIVLYYVDPSDSDFEQLDLRYTTGNGETNLIGVHKQGVYDRFMGVTHVIYGLYLFAEYVDAIAVTTIQAAA